MTLYHYTSGQGLFGIVNSDELHCTNINFLNDPSEQSYFQELLKSIFQESKECEKIYSTLFNDSFQNAVLRPFETFVASFSKNPDSLSMWNYYAKGNGYNIGLDIDCLIEQNKDANVSIRKIELVYDQKQQLDRQESSYWVIRKTVISIKHLRCWKTRMTTTNLAWSRII